MGHNLTARSDPPPSLVGDNHIAELFTAATATPPGSFVEVGVYKGGTAWYLYLISMIQSRELYLYDTFNGIPHKDPGDMHSIGDFADTNFEQVQKLMPWATVVQGVFPQSAVRMKDPIAFAHLDCDQYRSVLEAATFLKPRMAKGGIMWFDDSPVLPGARRAVEELFTPEQLHLSSDHGKHFVVF